MNGFNDFLVSFQCASIGIGILQRLLWTQSVPIRGTTLGCVGYMEKWGFASLHSDASSWTGIWSWQ